MKEVVQGLAKFQSDVYPGQRPVFEKLATGQSPKVLFITCSDSRVVPSLITQTGPGDLFVIRNAGNIVPSYGEISDGVGATVEYAMVGLKCTDIVVCGHSDCGAMKGVLNPGALEPMPNVAAWLRHADTARRVAKENYANLSGADLLRATIEENVLAQLDNLKSHPSVAARLRRGEVRLHGWVYNIGEGSVQAHSPSDGKFVALSEAPAYKEAFAG